MRRTLSGQSVIEATIGAVALLLVCAAIWISLRVRVMGIDQPYLMILDQEVLFGHHREFIDLPSGVIMNAPPLLAFHWYGWPIVFSWNLYVAVLTGISGCIFAFRMNSKSPGILMCLWSGAILLLFDDTLLGQREYFFSIFWFPYLVARFAKPSNGFAVVLDVLCGFLLSVAISVKFYFAAFVLLIDIPVLLLRRREQSFAAFWSMVAGGIIQTTIFLISYGGDLNSIKERMSSYYGTVGIRYSAVLAYLLGAPAVYVSIAALFLLFGLCLWAKWPTRYLLACLATGVICLSLSILQGHPRPYTLIPLFLASLAGALHTAYSMPATSFDGEPGQNVAVWRAVIFATFFVTMGTIIFCDIGLGRAFLMRYLWKQADYARIGPVPEDEYMSWVKKNVAKNETIEVIALQYGGTSAFDPVLSTIRLGRRVNSVNPILQFPLRAALVSRDRDRIDAAWDAVIKEISTAHPAWIVIRRTTPERMAPDFVKIVETAPRFYSWLMAHYAQYEAFGPYVAYRRLQ